MGRLLLLLLAPPSRVHHWLGRAVRGPCHLRCRPAPVGIRDLGVQTPLPAADRHDGVSGRLTVLQISFRSAPFVVFSGTVTPISFAFAVSSGIVMELSPFMRWAAVFSPWTLMCSLIVARSSGTLQEWWTVTPTLTASDRSCGFVMRLNGTALSGHGAASISRTGVAMGRTWGLQLVEHCSANP